LLTDAQLLLDQSLQHVSNQMRVLHGKDRAALQIEWLELIAATSTANEPEVLWFDYYLYWEEDDDEESST
tara:strand:- start:483 stop:692 length:210 start_codon:yes stop_codon:yes gene_type:complete